MDDRFVDHTTKNVRAVGISCPCISIGKRSPRRGRPLRFELKKQYPGYDVEQYNIIIDVLGVWSTTMRKLFGSRGYDLLRRMQKATFSSSLNTVRTLKATVT